MIKKGIWNDYCPISERKLKGIISQEETVCNMLSTVGEISRNWALENEIMHLAATVDLIRKKRKLTITAVRRGNDCIYTLIKAVEVAPLQEAIA